MVVYSFTLTVFVWMKIGTSKKSSLDLSTGVKKLKTLSRTAFYGSSVE